MTQKIMWIAFVVNVLGCLFSMWDVARTRRRMRLVIEQNEQLLELSRRLLTQNISAMTTIIGDGEVKEPTIQ